MKPLSYLSAALDADFGSALRGEVSWREIAGDPPMTKPALDVLDRSGVPRPFLAELAGAGDLAVASVELSRDGSRFAFGGPDRRLILAVRDEWSEVVDLVALSSSCEDEWAVMLGHADMLGGVWLDRAHGPWLGDDEELHEPLRELRLFATPMAWLRSGGAGICVVDWNPSALAELRSLGWGAPGIEGDRTGPCTLVVDPGAKTKLSGLLQYGGLPLVAEQQAVRRAA